MGLRIILGAASAAWYALLRSRLLPKKVMQIWFSFCVAVSIIPAAIIIRPISALQYIGVPRTVTEELGLTAFCCAMRFSYYANPQIQMKVEFGNKADGTPFTWAELLENKSTAVLMNHTSFWDTFVFVIVCPLRYAVKIRSLMKAGLLSIPLFGPACNCVGHFPVYFKSDAEGNFQVDHEKQEKVSKRIENHLEHGGSLALFPEGAINKTPETLLPFRYGTFNTILQHNLSIVYMLCVGNAKTWPAKAAIGGFPADITIHVAGYEKDLRGAESKELSLEVHDKMMEVYNTVAAKKKN